MTSPLECTERSISCDPLKPFALAPRSGEHLCFGSSSFLRGPGGLGAEDGVEDGEELPRAGDDGNLGQLACGDEAFVEGTDGGIRSNGGEGTHVEDGSDACSATPDAATSTLSAAVAIEWCDPYEGGDLPSAERAELRNH